MPIGRRRSKENRKGSLRLFGKEVFFANSEKEREDDWSGEILHVGDRSSETDDGQRRLYPLVRFASRCARWLPFLANV